jgi:hypothetical protein
MAEKRGWEIVAVQLVPEVNPGNEKFVPQLPINFKILPEKFWN